MGDTEVKADGGENIMEGKEEKVKDVEVKDTESVRQM